MQAPPEAVFEGIDLETPGALDEWLKDGHKLFLGKTETGKTGLLKTLHRHTALRSVFINPHREVVEGPVCASTQEVHAAFKAGEQRVSFHLPRLDDFDGSDPVAQEKAYLAAVRASLQRLFQFLTDLGEAMRPEGEDATPVWCIVFVAESHRLAPKHGAAHGPVEQAFAEIRKFGVRLCVDEQRAARIAEEAITESRYKVVFDLGGTDEGYLKRKGIPYAEFSGHTMKRYHFVVIRSGAWVPFDPVPKYVPPTP